LAIPRGNVARRPAAVDLKIMQCDPTVKGNSATSRIKRVTLET
jgi:hypothetical protein